MPAALDDMALALRQGRFVAGFLAYDAGAAFDALAIQSTRLVNGPAAPLLWFGVFETKRDGRIDRERPARPVDVNLEAIISRTEYEAMVRAGLAHIRAGDVYQVNLTMPTRFPLAEPYGWYRRVRQRTGASFGALIETGCRTVLSFSPELFFDLDGDRVTTRPMKGTRPRAIAPVGDAANAASLHNSAKDRAENLMIVDLLRNDLSRVCRPGTVRVPHLFEIESYPTVWQMTSTVTGTLDPGAGPIEVLRALFPSGSITGAPKLMASRVIAEQESYARGVYTGSIGWMSAERATFNVAIRTVEVPRAPGGERIARLDIGAGIVADSQPGEEWLECLAKARFAGTLACELRAYGAVGRQ